MKTLITPLQVLRLAFGADEYLPPDTVRADDIAAACERYVVPVIGRSLYEKLLADEYPGFAADHLAAATALFTRIVVQPRLDIRTGRCGTTAPKSSDLQPADADARRAVMRSLRAQARTLLRSASVYLAAHPAEFPEYDPDRDIFNRCSTDGNFVQTR